MYKFYALVIISCWLSVGFAQKPALDHTVYDTWEHVEDLQMNKQGNYLLFSIMQQQGDARLIIAGSDGTRLADIPRGENAKFLEYAPFVVFNIKPPYAATRQARIDEKKKEDFPKDSLGLVNVKTKEVHKWPGLHRYKLPKEDSPYIGFLTEPEQDSLSQDMAEADSATKRTKDKATSYDLNIWSVVSGSGHVIEGVSDFFFNETGDQLVYIRSSNTSAADSNGIFLVKLPSWEVKQLSSGKGTYSNITFDKSGGQLAFTAEKSPEKALLKPYSLYYYKANGDSAHVIADSQSTGVPKHWNVSGHGALRFSADGRRLFFGLAPVPRVKDTTLVDFEVAKLDIWHWKDDYLQPQQLLTRQRDRNKSYLAVLYLNNKHNVIPLGSPEVPDVDLTEDANEDWVLATSDIPYRIASQWEGGAARDVYLISTHDGHKVNITTALNGYPYIDPKGNHLIWFDQESQQWVHYDIARETQNILNENIGVPFGDEENDQPTFARAYGMAGWDADGEGVYIYDRYDIWRFSLKSNSSENVTNGVGRKQGVSFHYTNLEARKQGYRRRQSGTVIHADSTWLLSAFNHQNKEQGWYSMSRKGKLSEYSMDIYRYNQVTANQSQDRFAYTKESYKASPDVYVSLNFQKEVKLSDINPQQDRYNWGDAELVHWKTPKGFNATGILYKPEDFDPNKKYPMLVYFYEKLSDGLYGYIPPAPTPSRLNISYFVSNGYLVFAPDIEYQIGYPGKSAEEFINSGVSYLSQNDWVDDAHIGIQGQSWGGYQVAHLITRTHMYAAAWSGAPVVNMTSAYGGIRWGSGRNRQFQYERTQSRIGKDLWSGLDLYMENSPLFHLKNVETPVVIMSNDGDGAVPWYQGIEMFTALRRLGKPVWLLNYNGEEHNLVLRQNRKDIQRREQQFFDHYLKGAPAPVWLESGVPATLKGIDWGFDLVK